MRRFSRVSGLFGLAIALGVCATGARGQQPPTISFDAASVKANRSGAVRTDAVLAGGRFGMINETTWRLIAEAYADPLPLTRMRILGGPGWLDSERFDVEGIATAPLTRERARQMLRTLLADRFQLRIHTDTRQLPVFDLVRARADGSPGPMLRRSDLDCQALAAKGASPISGEPTAAPPCIINFGFGRLSARGMTMADLAATGLSRVSGRTTIDRTALTGPFDWTLVWTPDNLPPRPAGVPADQPLLVNGIAIDPTGPPLATALQEQLGLRLQPATGPIDVIVIDRIERPTDN